jgi:hypothetical protein
MCIGCWYGYGSPRLVTDAIRETVALIARVYEGTYAEEVHYPEDVYYPGNAAGGNLHTILDDWNIDVDETSEYAPTYTDAPHQHAVERACYDHFRHLTLPERAAALAWYHGYISEDVPGAPVERSWSAGVRHG